MNFQEIRELFESDNAIGKVSRMDAINNKAVLVASLIKAKERRDGLKRKLDELGTRDFDICPKCKNKIMIESSPMGRFVFLDNSRNLGNILFVKSVLKRLQQTPQIHP